MIVIGIDPGIRGALAALDDDGMTIVDMPFLKIKRGAKTKSIVDVRALCDDLGELSSSLHAFVEIAGSRPQQATASTSTVWMNYGRLLGCLETLGVPITEVSSKKWKKALGVPADKDGARFRASQLLPRYADQWPLKKHDGRAEAALIALWGWNSFLSEYKT
jgi:crossover junction endodeoxyribonuclease RuvC